MCDPRESVAKRQIRGGFVYYKKIIIHFDTSSFFHYSLCTGGMAELVEGAALEMRYVRKGIGGSNPSPTAKAIYYRNQSICL